jgi:hypothetical protein
LGRKTFRGEFGRAGIERIATDSVFELLDVPPFKRKPEAAKRLKGLMVELGLTPVRSRHVTGHGHAARVRGFARSSPPDLAILGQRGCEKLLQEGNGSCR